MRCSIQPVVVEIQDRRFFSFEGEVFMGALARLSRRHACLGIFAATIVLATGSCLLARQGKDVLRIGSSGSLTSSSNVKEEDALETLRGFIKEETGMENQIIREKNWQELVDKIDKKDLQIGVFQGYEFAWAKQKVPTLKPLMMAVRVHPFARAYIIVNKTIANKPNPAKDFAGLAGQTLSIPLSSRGFPELFIEREAEGTGKKLDAFFGKISKPAEVEDAIDDVVDGIVQVTVVDQPALEAYKRRKPGRFAKIKLIAQSQPFPPPIIAYKENDLDEPTLKKFRDGLISASTKERGQRMLNMFRLTAFETPPADFEKVLGDTLKKYPAPK
jgi:ABC-type phosphate/phosphonate transport system substrate-binding protein